MNWGKIDENEGKILNLLHFSHLQNSSHCHGYNARCLKWQKKSHLALRAKQATFTVRVVKSSLKVSKMVHFSNPWCMQSRGVTREVDFNETTICEKYQKWEIKMRHFCWFQPNVKSHAQFFCRNKSDLSGNTVWQQPLGFQKLITCGTLNEILSTRYANVSRFPRNVEWDFSEIFKQCGVLTLWWGFLGNF